MKYKIFNIFPRGTVLYEYIFDAVIIEELKRKSQQHDQKHSAQHTEVKQKNRINFSLNMVIIFQQQPYAIAYPVFHLSYFVF